jgi:hypothetical protein
MEPWQGENQEAEEKEEKDDNLLASNASKELMESHQIANPTSCSVCHR